MAKNAPFAVGAVALGFAVLALPAYSGSGDKEGLVTIQRGLELTRGKVSVDVESRLKPAIMTFRVKNLISHLLEWAVIQCEFYNANGDVAGWGTGAVSYLDPEEAVEGEAIAPKTPNAVSASCRIKDAKFR